jgi:hypothetical protein
MNGHTLTLNAYYPDFAHNFHKPGTTFWKFERGQHYAEPHNPSWKAFHDGNWENALHLIETERERLTGQHEQLNAEGINTYRVRIVDYPLTPYLQWELHYLHLRHQTGGPVHIYPAHLLAPLEHTGHELPDLNICAPHATYIPNYDDNGVLASATKYPWGNSITRYVKHLYKLGQPIDTYFQTHIAHLPPPATPPHVPDDYLETTGRPQPTRS